MIPFRKVLVANRGEIACRVLRTLRRLNIASVAVYHDEDRNAPHVAMANEAIRLEGKVPSGAYLDQGQIIAACRFSGTEAIHPGYGFLSENADFAEAVEFRRPRVRRTRTRCDPVDGRQGPLAGIRRAPRRSGGTERDRG